MYALPATLNANWGLKMPTIDQKNFIVSAFCPNTSPTKLGRKFFLHFKIECRTKIKYGRRYFINVCQKLENNGSATLKHLWPKFKETAASIGNVFTEDPLVFLRKAAPIVGMFACIYCRKSSEWIWMLNFNELQMFKN